MEWPPQWPNNNPIKLLWNHLEREARKISPSSKAAFWNFLQNMWDTIDTLPIAINRKECLESAFIGN